MKLIRSLVRFLAFTSSGAAVFTLYLIVPSLITARAVFPSTWAGTFIAFAVLGAGELLIYSILLRTTRRRTVTHAVPERRAWVRQLADFNVEIHNALAGRRVPARAVNASGGGLAVLVEAADWDAGRQDRRVQLQVPGHGAFVDAEPVDLTQVVVDGREQRLVRLRLFDGTDYPAMSGNGSVALPARNGGWPYGGTLGAPTNGHVPATADTTPALGAVRAYLLSFVALCSAGVRRIGQILPLPLWIVLAVQSAASVSMRNTVFQDEATYLYAGRQIVHHLQGGPAPTEWVGDFLAGTTLYPIVGGAIDSVGGLEAARLFSLFWMLCATIAVYATARGLYNRATGLLAAALFGLQGSVLFIGHFATFDAMAVGLLALASALAVHAGGARRSWAAPFVSVLLLVAGAATYVSFLYIPTVLALLCWQAFRVRGWKQAALRTGLASAVLGVAGAMAVEHYPGGVGAFNSSIAQRIAAVPAPASELVQLILYLTGVVLVLAGLGLLVSRRAYLPLAVLLLGSALAAPAYHIMLGEFTSLQKHVAYGTVFAAPLAGYTVIRLSGRRRMIAVVLCFMIFTTGYEAERRLGDWWPNSSAAIAVLQNQVRPGDRILAEEHEVLEYYLTKYEADRGHLNWSQTYGFQYTNSTGQYLDGVPAYKAAIADGYFNLVVLRYGPTAKMDHAIDGGLRDGTRYELVAKIPYDTAFGASDYWIWRRRPAFTVAGSPTPLQPAVQSLKVYNGRHTVVGGRSQPCDLRQNAGPAKQPGCEVVSSVWLPNATITYTLIYPDGTKQTFVDTADSRGHSLHAFAVTYRPPLHAVHGQPSTVVRIQVTGKSNDGKLATTATERFAVIR